MLDQYDNEKNWPARLPEKLHRPLDDLAALVAAVRKQQDGLLPTDMKREAKRIGNNAIKLLSAVREFEKHYFPVFNVTNYRDSAIEAFDLDLSEEELTLCQAGMSPYSLQWPLLALKFQMDAIAATKGKSGPIEAKTAIYHHAMKETARWLNRAGIDDRALFIATCKTLLARAGYPATDDQLEHYARKLGGAKS